jgi:hypothetical protein
MSDGCTGKKATKYLYSYLSYPCDPWFLFLPAGVEGSREGRAATISFPRDLRDRHGIDRRGTARPRLQSDWF